MRSIRFLKEHAGTSLLVLAALMIAIAVFTAGCLGTSTAWDDLAGAHDEAHAADSIPDQEYTLTALISGYEGVGNSIDGQVNPDLIVGVGETIELTLVGGEDVAHDLAVGGLGDVHTDLITTTGAEATIAFSSNVDGTFPYYCTIPGHRLAGMEGNIIVGTGVGSGAGGGPVPSSPGPAKTTDLTSIAKDPLDIPPPITRNTSKTVHFYMDVQEVVAEMEDGTTYEYWAYNGTVPGPMLRARVGDTVVVHFQNAAGNTLDHNVDFHAVTGQGGGATATVTSPGGETTFSFLALHPGVFIYHCATQDVPTHISHGMYGLAVIEPEEGLPPVDKEFYVVQGDLYTKWKPGTGGHQEDDSDRLFEEQPTYVVFNGAHNALTGSNTMTASVGDTVRIFFGVGGPNLISSFHVIGEIFDRVWLHGGLVDPPMNSIQTTIVMPGGGTMVEITFDVPATYLLVDHALTRAFHKGALATIVVTGPEDIGIFASNGPGA